MKTWKVNLKRLTIRQYEYLREICHLSKNVYNESVYNIRQHYFTEGTYLRYEANYSCIKNSENYIKLGANQSQQTMKAADQSFKSFFALLNKTKQGKYQGWKVKLPHYLKKDDLYPVTFMQFLDKASKTGKFTIPVSLALRETYRDLSCRFKVTIPEYVRGKNIKLIRISPKCQGRYFEMSIVFDDNEVIAPVLNEAKALAIDLGINNFATCATSEGDSFIVDGRKIKSINQWYNKELARLSSIKDHQKIKGCTNKQYTISCKRNRRVYDYIHKSAKYIVNYCISNNVGNIVIGYNDGFVDAPDLGKVNNQQFVMLPYGKFKSRLEYLCKLYGINYQVQEESYTSKASFWDKDEIPKWNPLNPKQGNFSGKRIKRGLYQTSSGKLLNADVNGALNILRKSNIVSLETLYARGDVLTPTRIRLA